MKQTFCLCWTIGLVMSLPTWGQTSDTDTFSPLPQPTVSPLISAEDRLQNALDMIETARQKIKELQQQNAGIPGPRIPTTRPPVVVGTPNLVITPIPNLRSPYLLGRGNLQYQATNLGDFGPTSLNNHGQVVGTTYSQGEGIKAVYWDSHNGQIKLDTPQGANSVAYDINNHGQIVGWIQGLGAACWSQDGRRIELPATCNTDSGFGRINDQGDMAGCDSQGAFVWNADKGLTHLNTFGGNTSMISDINNEGVIVGYSHLDGLTTEERDVHHPFRWQGPQGIQEIIALEKWEMGCAQAINDQGAVVGNARYAFVWDAIHGQRQIASALGYCRPTDINNSGVVVGDISWTENQIENHHGFIWTEDQGAIDLNLLLTENSPWTCLNTAYGINDQGQILTSGITRDGEYQTLLLTPVPEPATLLLLCLSGLTLRRKRR